MTQTLAPAQEQKAYEPLNPNHPRLAIKHGAAFLLTDMNGMLPGDVAQGFGFYHDDTRWLRRWELTLSGKPLFMLNSDVEAGFAANFTYGNQSGELPAQSLMIARDLVINEGLTERVTIQNFNAQTANIELVLHFDSDYADMFEVRGTQRTRRGQSKNPECGADRRRVTLSYVGLDKLLRETAIDFLGVRPSTLTGKSATFRLKLKRHEKRELLFQVSTRIGGGDKDKLQAIARPQGTFKQHRQIAQARYQGWLETTAQITTGNPQFNAVLERAYNDIYILRQQNQFGTALAAGVPWFAVPFGRDDFITALQTVQLMPELAREILQFFALYQGKKYDEELAEEPGKMPHEIRTGEMANCAEIAFRPYYGTVDATQLWLMLLTAYFDQTNDLDLVRELWPHVESADRFLTHAARSGGSYISYGGKFGQALSNQGWKDSGNSIVYSDGNLAKAPIAVCEAQGYLYAGWMGMSRLAAALGKPSWYSMEFRAKATILQRRFEQDFWMEDKQFVALALDGDGRKCDVISSNPGHLLGTGLLSRERELIVADRLMRDDMYSGWGIRTLASSELAYQPMDYQLGSVWPHDTGYAVSHMPAIGRAESAHKVLKALFDAAMLRADLRLPELFCGFARQGTGAPIRYPVACVPQAWAAGCWFQMLSGCMNIKMDALNNRITITKPSLPLWLGTVGVHGLKVGDSEIDLEFAPNATGQTACRVTRLIGDIECVIE